MGLVQAAIDAAKGTLADQWSDFLTVPTGLAPTAAVFPAVKAGSNFGRGENTKSSPGVISNGSKIIVPEGYGLLVMQDGRLSAFSNAPGAYVWDVDDPNAKSVFAGDGLFAPLILQSWERFKFAGRPSSQQLALFVNLKELPNNRFGTQSPIYWDDKYIGAQVGALTHGTYSVTIDDPIKFAVEFLPAAFLQGLDVFDFTDVENDYSNQLFNEVISSLSAAFSNYTNLDAADNRITNIQRDALTFCAALWAEVDGNYNWSSSRGIRLSSVAILGINYDKDSLALLATVQRADALAGNRGNVNLQASVAEGIVLAGENAGGEGILGLGIAAGSIGLNGLMQQQPSGPGSQGVPAEGLTARLAELKAAMESNLISEAEYEAAKAKILGL